MPGDLSPYVWVLVVLAVGLRLLWRAKPKRLRIERMWITPSLILAGVAVSFAVQPIPRLPLFLAETAGLAVGSGVGWWRGATTRITIDPETHELTSQASVLGMALIVGVVGLRFALRDLAWTNAAAWRITPIEIADVSLLFAAGLVCIHRLEMWLRARRLLANARSGEN
jgi:hypothetical protein